MCDEAGLIGKEMFAVDGVKLPSNASKEWSGSQADYSKKIEKMERAVRHLTEQHRRADAAGEDEGAQRLARAKQQATLEQAIEKVRGFLRGHEDKVGAQRPDQAEQHHGQREREDDELEGRDPRAIRRWRWWTASTRSSSTPKRTGKARSMAC